MTRLLLIAAIACVCIAVLSLIAAPWPAEVKDVNRMYAVLLSKIEKL